MRLEENGIAEIPERVFENLNNLQFLYLYQNRIRRIDASWFSAHNRLRDINLSFNPIGKLTPSIFINLRNLTSLTWAFGIDEVLEGTFNQSKKLEHLKLPNSAMRSLGSSWFSEANKIREIYLPHSNITELKRSNFVYLSHLMYLYLDHAQIAYIENGAFEPLRELNTLNLSYNRLVQFDVSALFGPASNRLTRLSLNNIELTELSLNVRKAFPSMLDNLNIKDNQFNCTLLKY